MTICAIPRQSTDLQFKNANVQTIKLVKIRKQFQKYVVNWKGSLRIRYKELLT